MAKSLKDKVADAPKAAVSEHLSPSERSPIVLFVTDTPDEYEACRKAATQGLSRYR
jgi:hypothetical protein